MLAKTSEMALHVLVYLARHGGEAAVAPGPLAERLGASPTYLAKITGVLAKMGLVRAQRGAHGGVSLARAPQAITLLEVVEACQGRILGAYCQEGGEPGEVCGFHEAMLELHMAIVGVLARWSLADLAARPWPAPHLRDKVRCKMACVERASEARDS